MTIASRYCSNQRETLGLASLAAFRFVLELLIVKEQLFSGREQKLCTTIHTLQHFVLEFH
jgi:hypothetical protein